MNQQYQFQPRSARATKARLAKGPLGKLGTPAIGTGYAAIIAGLGLFSFVNHALGLAATGVGVQLLGTGWWLSRDIGHLAPAAFGTSTDLSALLPPELVDHFSPTHGTEGLGRQLMATWHGRFMMTRFGLHPDIIDAGLMTAPVELDQVWPAANAVAQEAGLDYFTSAAIFAALFDLCVPLQRLLTDLKISPADLHEGVAWIERLEAHQRQSKPIYGGFARDWAAGFTPLLNQFGQNFSQQIEAAGNRFGVQERTTQLDGLVSGLTSATGSVIVIGEQGIGKTALLYGLAERLLLEERGPLAHHQVVSLNASMILSSQKGPGDLEHIVLQLLGEAANAGNIVLALDEAQLFFGQGTGAVNLSQLLLPVLQARVLRLVLAVTPSDWQRLRATNPALAGLLTPLVLQEAGQAETIRLLADRALLLEQGKLTTTYQALVESYRLSSRYFTEEAQPGKSIKLLEAAMNHAEGPFVTATSVQRAVEAQLGVKVEQAAGTGEADVLLNLEDKIHERMINQTRAVSVVASALRRARAGVSNPRRPVGSFLFLGPTGVGKTELARSLAALYYGSERNMIRLDMSEYQQASDVARILAGAAENPQGLLARVRQQPFSVVLFDEIEKADPNILNLMLQLLDEGNLTDAQGHPTSFKDSIIIATSNAGADAIRAHIEAGEALEQFEHSLTDELISSGQFKPELLNRFDEIVLFRPLNPAELAQVVKLLIAEVNHTLEPQKISVTLTDAAIADLVARGYDPRLGARPMRRMVTRTVEDAVAGRILRGQAVAGDVIELTRADVGGAPEAAITTPAQPSEGAPVQVNTSAFTSPPALVVQPQGEVLYQRAGAGATVNESSPVMPPPPVTPVQPVQAPSESRETARTPEDHLS